MSVQREFACESRSIFSTLSMEESQPPTPRISHLQISDPIPELELPVSEDFEPAHEFSLECKEIQKNELTAILEDAEMSLVGRASGRNACSDLSARLIKRDEALGRTRIKSESLSILTSENSVFKFLVSRRLSAYQPELFP